MSYRKPWLYPDWIYYNLSSKGRRFKKACRYVHDVSEEIVQKRRKALVKHNTIVFSPSC